MKKRSILLAFTVAALIIVYLPCRAFAEQNPSPASTGIIEEKETTAKSGGPSESGVQVQEKGSVEAGKSGVSLQAVDEKKKQPLLDRRWIIKMKDEKNKKVTAKKPLQTAWSGKEQKSQCEAYIARLRESYSNVRHYSIHGDSCSTARHARIFLDLIEQCTKECPEGYSGSKGYSAQIIRNVDVLHELGQKRCLQAVTESRAGESESKARNGQRQSTMPMKKAHKGKAN